MKKSLLYFILVLSFSGCSSLQVPLNSIETTKSAQNQFMKNKSLVYGRLVSDNNQYEFSLTATGSSNNINYGISSPPSRYLFSKYKEDNRDGYFFVFLKPDDYKIKNINFGNGSYAGSVESEFEFNVPQDSIVYLGTFIFSWQGTKNNLVMKKGNVGIDVRDESDDALFRLWRRFPELKEGGLNVVDASLSLRNELMVQ